jgi:hypothetical protein
MHDETVSRLRRTVGEAQWVAAVETGRSATVDELMGGLDATLSSLDWPAGGGQARRSAKGEVV